MKRKIKEILAKISAFIGVATSRAYMMYADAFDDAGTAASSLQSRLFSLAEKLFPLAIVICAIAMFFTRDQKKFDTEKHILIGCCLAYGLLMLVQHSDIPGTISGLFGHGAGAGAGASGM